MMVNGGAMQPFVNELWALSEHSLSNYSGRKDDDFNLKQERSNYNEE